VNSQIRIGHFSPDAPNVTVAIDGDAVLENVSFRDVSDYMEIDAGSIDVSVLPADGSDAVIEATLDLESERFYTVLAVGELDSIDAMILDDEFEGREFELGRDEGMVRFVHCSPDAPAVDLRLADGSLLFEDVSFGDAAEFLTVDADSYDLEVVPSGSDDVVLSLSDLTIDAGTVYTAVAIGRIGDDSLDALVLEDFETVGRKAVR
jgi:hypothetical protein